MFEEFVCNNKGEYDQEHHDRDWPYKINGNEAHRDCWFEALGNTVEKHPIGLPVLIPYNKLE